MHIYTCIYTYTLLHEHLHIYIATWRSTHASTHIHCYMHIYTCIYTYTLLHEHLHMYLHTYIATWTSTHVSTHIHCYMNIYTCIYTYTVLHAHILWDWFWGILGVLVVSSKREVDTGQTQFYLGCKGKEGGKGGGGGEKERWVRKFILLCVHSIQRLPFLWKLHILPSCLPQTKKVVVTYNCTVIWSAI